MMIFSFLSASVCNDKSRIVDWFEHWTRNTAFGKLEISCGKNKSLLIQLNIILNIYNIYNIFGRKYTIFLKWAFDLLLFFFNFSYSVFKFDERRINFFFFERLQQKFSDRYRIKIFDPLIWQISGLANNFRNQ